MTEKNKILFGVSNLHFCTYDVDDNGDVTLGTPVKIPGTTNISLDPEAEETSFYADNIVYWGGYSDNGYSGEITNALFPDDFKTQFLNYVKLDDDGIAQIKGMASKRAAMMFQIEGDVEARRGILYNVALGSITREYPTVEDSITPQTATLSFRVHGDNATGIVRVAYTEETTVYETLFSNPPVPTLPASE